MSKFYVGQRVRIVRVWHPSNRHLVGREATVIAICDYGIDTDVGVSSSTVGRGHKPDHLEPLQPERNQTIAWSECVWKPEHMRAEA